MSSNKKKYFEVEETFKDGDVELKVVESTSLCNGCYYFDLPEEKCEDAPICASGNSSVILNHVIFVRHESNNH